MRHTLFTVIFIVFLSLVTSVQAQEIDVKSGKLYLSGAFGYSTTDALDWTDGNQNGNIEAEKTVNFATALGFNFTPHLAAEVEFSYRNAGLDELTVDGAGDADLTGDFKSWAGMVNSYLFLAPRSTFNPFLSIGLGLVRHDVTLDPVPAFGVTAAGGTRTVLAYQYGLGVELEIDKKTHAVLGYRFFGSERPTFGPVELDYGSHEVRIGLKQTF